MSDIGRQPPKRIRENQGHFTDAPKMTRDARDEAPRRVAPKPACTKENKAPAFRQRDYTHPDASELPSFYRRRSVTMQCPHCGHNWTEPR